MAERVIIVGGGFAGITAARTILKECGRRADREVILISKTNYFLFYPLLPEVATGSLSRSNIAEAIPQVLHHPCFRFYTGTVESIDLEKRRVKGDFGTMTYDKLVLAPGFTVNFHGVKGAEKHCLTLGSVKDADRMKNRVIRAVQEANECIFDEDHEAAECYLTLLVVGGGPTGIEIVGEIADFVKEIVRNYPHIDESMVRIELIHNTDRLLPMVHQRLMEKSIGILRKKGVTIRLNQLVKEVGSDFVTLGNGEKIRSRTVIWTAGVKPNAVTTTPSVLDEKGFYEVDDHLRLRGFEDAYAAGDCAKVVLEGKRLPQLAQVAVEEGKYVGRHLLKKEDRPFTFTNRGFLINLGKGFGVAEVFGIQFKGFFAWWLKRTVHLFQLLGTANKVQVAWNWTINLFMKRDIVAIED